MSELRSKCRNWSAPQFRHCITWWSLMISYECITISSLFLNSDICSSILTFGQTPQKWPILTPKKEEKRPPKKDFLRIHMGMAFLQKTGSKSVKFGPCGPIYISPGHIGGRHPVPCLITQIAERQGTAMYYMMLLFWPWHYLAGMDHHALGGCVLRRMKCVCPNCIFRNSIFRSPPFTCFCFQVIWNCENKGSASMFLLFQRSLHQLGMVSSRFYHRLVFVQGNEHSELLEGTG